MIRVIIVEDQAMLRESLALAIGTQDDMEVVGCYSDAVDVIEGVSRLHPDLVLMDVCTEHDSSGIVAAAKLKENDPTVKVVIMTGMPEVTFIQQAHDAGADSFIYKNVGTNELLAVIRSTLQGYSTFPLSRSARDDALSELTPEEIAILRLVCENKSRKEIASGMFLSEGTVKRHISEILAKTGYDSIMKLAVHAVSRGYIVPRLRGSE